jgi:putative PEP-CTERM system TPR-repeat lipoprotein
MIGSLLPVLMLVAGTVPLSRAADAPDSGIEISRYYEDALSRFGKEDYRGAAIQLKNGLQLDSRHLPSRILLGKAYLAAGFPVQARAEFLLARGMGADPALIDIPLAESLSKLGQYDELLAEVDPARHGPQEAARLEVLRGNAYLAQGDDARAALAFKQALRLDDRVEGAVSGQAKVQMARGQLVQAGELLDQAIARNPAEAELWFLKGRIASTGGRPEQGLAHLTKAIELDPEYRDVRLFRAMLLVDLERLELAQQDLDLLYAQPRVEPMAAYLQAVVDARSGHLDKARQSLAVAEEALALIPPETLDRTPRMQLLAGTVAYLQGNFETASHYLQSYLRRDYGNARARQMMAHIQLERGQLVEAMKTLRPLLDAKPDDPMVQMLLGRLHLARKDYAAAARVFEKLAAQQQDDPKLQLRLAQSLIADRQISGAIAALEQAQQLGAGGVNTGLMLASLQLGQGNLEKAIVAARAVLEKEPDNLRGLNLLGLAQLASGDTAGARASFQRAMQLDPDNLTLRLNLGRVAIAEGAPEKARETYQALLARNPEQRETLIAIAELEEAQGDLVQAIRWREKLRDYRPDDLGSNLKLIDDYLKNRQPEKAVEVAQALQTQYPEEYSVRLALGISEMAAGRTEDARLTFSKLESWVSYDTDKLYQIAGYQKRLGDLKSAYWTLTKAADGAPDRLDVAVDLALVEIQLNKLDAALGRALNLQIQHPERGEGWFLEGEARFSEGDMKGAEPAYMKSQVIKPESIKVIRLYQIAKATGRPDAALQRLESWLAGHGDDLQVYKLLAAEMIQQGRHADARKKYEEMLTQWPEDTSLLNDLAMLYQMAGDARALGIAEKAYRLAPTSGPGPARPRARRRGPARTGESDKRGPGISRPGGGGGAVGEAFGWGVRDRGQGLLIRMGTINGCPRLRDIPGM